MTETGKQKNSIAMAREALDKHLAGVFNANPDQIKEGYDKDAILRLPDGEICGRDAIGEWYRQNIDLCKTLNFRFERIEIKDWWASIKWWADSKNSNILIEGHEEFFINSDGFIQEQLVPITNPTERSHGGIRFELEPPLARLILDRDAKRNAVSQAMLKIMKQSVAEVADNPNISALVISGIGKDFCAGEDVRGFDFPDAGSVGRFLDGPLDFFNALETMNKPVIVAVHGHALGFGSEILLVADGVFSSPDAVFGFAEIDHGAVPSVAVSRGLGMIFRRRVLDLALTGRRFDVKTAIEAHLVHAMADNPIEAADQAAIQMASWSPDSVSLIKSLLGHGSPEDHDRARDFMISPLTHVKAAL
jgi:enoyl-CoA hydratase/carnithine racemase